MKTGLNKSDRIRVAAVAVVYHEKRGIIVDRANLYVPIQLPAYKVPEHLLPVQQDGHTRRYLQCVPVEDNNENN